MTTLEAIELLKSTPPTEVSVEQLAGLRQSLEKTPSLYAVLGGRTRVDAYINQCELAMDRPVAVESVEAAPAAAPSQRPPWSRRRTLEVAFFGSLLFVVVVAFLGVLISLSLVRSAKSSPHQIATAADNHIPENMPNGTPSPAGFSGSARNIPTSLAAQTDLGNPKLIDEPANVWQGWTLTKSGKSAADKSADWDLSDAANPRPIYRLTSHGSLTFERTQQVPAGTGSLNIDCTQARPVAGGKIELLIDGQTRGMTSVPPPGSPDPILLPLTLNPGSRVTIKIVYTPRNPQEVIQWRGMALSDERVEVMAPTGEPDATRPSLRLWLRADLGVTDAAGHSSGDAGFDGKVQTWEDQSPQHFQFLAGSSTNLPAYVAAEPMLKKKPGVNFAGAYLRSAGQSVYDAESSTSLCVFTVQALARKQKSRAAAVLGTSAPCIGWQAGAYHNGRGRFGQEITFNAPQPLVSKMMPMGNYALITAAKISDRSTFIEINGRARMYVEARGSRSGDVLTLGGSHAAPGSFGGTIAEVLVYNRGLSTVELHQLGKYLQQRYGIAGDY